MANNNQDICKFEEKKAQFKELKRQQSILSANLLTEYELPIHLQQELMVSRNELDGYLNQKGIYK